MKISIVLIYGILFWIALSVISALLFMIIKSENFFRYIQSFQPLFLSVQIMLCGIFSYIFYRNYKVSNLKDGFIVGLFWAGVSILIDLVFEFLLNQTITLSSEKYIKNIVPYYVFYPLITSVIWFLFNRKNHNLK